MKNIFRPVDFWKSAVMTMPDNSFFELIRNVFGKIKTPFNKQHLINDLEIFLLREDIQKTITAYIGEDDAKVIAAVAVFGEPVTGELESFFSGELSCAQLQDIIVNLEERFILYRFTEESTGNMQKYRRLALNPVLEQVLLPFTANVSSLFSASSEVNESAGSSCAASLSLNDRVIAGLLSFASGEEIFFRSEGVIRKRVIETGKSCFPGMDLNLVFGALQVLGLFYADKDRLVPDPGCFDDFTCLSARERMEYCAAGLMIYSDPAKRKAMEQSGILPPIYRNNIRGITIFISCILNTLEVNLLYPEKSIKRMIQILMAKTGTDINSALLLDALEKTGLVVTVSPELKQLGSIVHNKAEKKEKTSIVIDSGFSVIVYPEIEFTDVIRLTDFLDIHEAGEVVRFELNRESAVRAFDKSIKADKIIELLKKLSGDRVDETFIWNLKDWEKRHSEVSLKKGVILSLSEDRRYLTETRPLAVLIKETLAPGLYLLDENALDEAAAVLRIVGIDIVARPGYKKNKTMASYNYFPSLAESPSHEKFITAAIDVFHKKNDGLQKSITNNTPACADTLIANLHVVLKKMSLTEIERTELSARIDRHLVLCESQLKHANLRYEKLEARHMDYAGKQNIAKQAIMQQSPVEIKWLAGGKEGERIFGTPKSLEKENGGLTLVLIDANGQAVRVPLGKISFLRRIKKSIFET
jgi:hypothetical protein